MAEKPKTFQDKTLERVQQQIAALLEEIPELRSAVIVFDWEGALNEAAVPGIWLDREGLVTAKSVQSTANGMVQLTRMFRVQQQIALQQIAGLQATIDNKQQIANSVQERLDAHKQTLDAARESQAEQFQRPSQPGHDPGGSAATGQRAP